MISSLSRLKSTSALWQGSIVPVDAGENGPLEFLATQVLLRARFQKAPEFALRRKLDDLTPAGAQATGIHAPGDQQLGELLARGVGEIAVPLARRLEQVFLWAVEATPAWELLYRQILSAVMPHLEGHELVFPKQAHFEPVSASPFDFVSKLDLMRGMNSWG